MARMQGPPVVGRDEGPALRRAAELGGVLLDVADRAADIVGVVEEDFPSGAASYGVVGGDGGGSV